MADNGAAIAFCPTSNLFLGSGLFDMRAARDKQIRVGLGTDVGGGTSMSVLRTASEAYKVLHLQEQALPPFYALYLATLGAAKALYLEDKIGNFEPGKEADFVVLDSSATSLTYSVFPSSLTAMSLGKQKLASAAVPSAPPLSPEPANTSNSPDIVTL